MFQPQPTPFSAFFPSYLAGSLDGFSQTEPQPEDNGLQVDNTSFVLAPAQAQAAAQAGGFSNFQQATFAHAPAPSLLEYQLESRTYSLAPLTIDPCPGPVPGSTGGDHGGGSCCGAAGAGVGAAGAAPGPLSLSPQQQVQLEAQMQVPVGSSSSASGMGMRMGMSMGMQVGVGVLGFPLHGHGHGHGAIPQFQHQLPLSSAAASSLFDHNPNPNPNTNPTQPPHSSSSTFHHRTSRPHQRENQRQRQPHYRCYPHRPTSIPGTKMEPDQSVQDDLAAQQAAARAWQPDLEGPRVGDKTPIDAITEEYAKADPVYVAKTMALPQTYTHYRPIKGDGSCGWRAIVFSYFELLIEQGSGELLQGEVIRLQQLNDYLVNSGGYDPDMFMDFTEETFELFKQIADNIQSPEVAAALLETKFNDDSSMSLLFHFRILAGSWLKGHRDQYDAWCEDGVDAYVHQMIDPIDREIEELGVTLLVEVLLRPVGFTLEIAYLDRSAGTEVNTHRFPESTANSGGPFMHLLYRPGHYDILYKPNTSQAIQVNRMSYEPASFAPTPQLAPSYYDNPMMMIPGMGGFGQFSNPMGQLGGSSLDFAPSPQSPWFPSPCADTSPTPSTPRVAGPPAYATPQQENLPTAFSQSTAQAPATQHEIRFSPYQYEEAMEVNPWPEQSFQTTMFKNSHFNKAHYNNPDFTPEAYNPGADDVGERPEKPKKKGYGKGGRQSSEDSTDSKKEK